MAHIPNTGNIVNFFNLNEQSSRHPESVTAVTPAISALSARPKGFILEVIKGAGNGGISSIKKSAALTRTGLFPGWRVCHNYSAFAQWKKAPCYLFTIKILLKKHETFFSAGSFENQ
ncbi:MAG: hypothetical protein PHX07_07375 [Candidatus Marinimicrobia bacterium]|nr:hypothetical protein [Candidatus Neomarinimicrobiota bacterium]